MVNAAEPFDLEGLWQQTLQTVTPEVSSPIQREWLAATRPVGFSEDTVIIATPHSFAREWLTSTCGDRLERAMSDAAGRPLTVMITVKPRPEPVDPLTDGSETGRESADASPGDDRNSRDAAGVSLGDNRNHRDGGVASGGGSPPATGGPTGDDQPPSVPGRVGSGRAPEQGQPETAADPTADRAPGTPHPATDRIDSDRPDVGDRPLEAPGRPPGPTVVVDQPSGDGEAAQQPGAGRTQGQLNPKYVFENFVVGASNRFARAAARAVAEAPAKSYNPLFIYGDAGLGKTHLLHAVAHYVTQYYPRLTVRYVATEQFLNHFIDAVQNGRMTEFQHTYRQADVLLIDDIQFIESKDRTQEEFFHTFNALHNAEKQIVISSDRPPKQMVALEDRLRSRFQWGLITDIQPPDLETRIAILRKKSQTDNLNVSEEVLELIASRVQSNIRELEGALIRVTAFASLQQAPADGRMAERVLKDLFPDDRQQEVDCGLIMDATADYFGVTVEDFRSKSRTRHLTTGRQIAMYLVREMTEMSLPEIGRAFDRDHTTVIHAKDKIADLMQERQKIYDQVLELTSRIKAQARVPR